MTSARSRLLKTFLFAPLALLPAAGCSCGKEQGNTGFEGKGVAATGAEPLPAPSTGAEVEGLSGRGATATSPSGPRQFVRHTSNGYVEFYTGESVRDGLRRSGAYTPDLKDSYAMIRVPRRLIPATPTSDPITVSLCDPAHDVLVYDYEYIGAEKIREYHSTVPDPILSTTEQGALIQSFRSGAPGVYGKVQVSYSEDGYLMAGVSASFLIEFKEGPFLSRNGGMLLGRMADDPSPEDPILKAGGCICDRPGC